MSSVPFNVNCDSLIEMEVSECVGATCILGHTFANLERLRFFNRYPLDNSDDLTEFVRRHRCLQNIFIYGENVNDFKFSRSEFGRSISIVSMHANISFYEGTNKFPLKLFEWPSSIYSLRELILNHCDLDSIPWGMLSQLKQVRVRGIFVPSYSSNLLKLIVKTNLEILHFQGSRINDEVMEDWMLTRDLFSEMVEIVKERSLIC